MSDDDAQVTYSVKELLSSIKADQIAGFATLNASLKAKADKADVARLESTLAMHAKKIGDLETWRHDKDVAAGVHTTRDERSWASRHRVLSVLYALATLAAMILGPYVAIHL